MRLGSSVGQRRIDRASWNACTNISRHLREAMSGGPRSQPLSLLSIARLNRRKTAPALFHLQDLGGHGPLRKHRPPPSQRLIAVDRPRRRT